MCKQIKIILVRVFKIKNKTNNPTIYSDDISKHLVKLNYSSFGGILNVRECVFYSTSHHVRVMDIF